MRALALLVFVVGCGSGAGSGAAGGGDASGGGDANGGGAGGGDPQTCDSSNCAGCCLGSTCQVGSTAAACGKGAVECVGCGTNEVCRTDQTCGVDPESMWTVQPTRATIAASDNGAEWDPDGSAPDCRVDMYCPATAGSVTSTAPEASNTYSPAWTKGGCTMRAADLLSTGFAFHVVDDDTVSDDSVTGKLLVVVTESMFVAAGIDLGQNGGVQTMHIALSPK